MPDRALAAAETAPWWFGIYVDHLYELCPHRQRSLPQLQQAGQDRQGRGSLDPEGTDVCGWCRNVYRARRRHSHPDRLTQPEGAAA